MNLAIRGIEADISKEHSDTFRNVQHPDLRADYVFANGSMSTNQSSAGDIRRAFMCWKEEKKLCCIVALAS